MAIQTVPAGGSFLLGESNPHEVYTPEDFTDEQRLLMSTIRDFVTQEVLPKMAAIEAKTPGLIPELLKKAGEIGLLSLEIPEVYGGAEMGIASGMMLMESTAVGGGSFLTSIADHVGIGTLPIV
ncbi:hypothetical protein C2W62_35620 [Candidatus Entotheonella serta]|nr:hypothetical protein C2W62_35620 [Candidatus Entotheonella serta]